MEDEGGCLMALRSVPEHPKFARLQAILGLKKYQAMGILETLWHLSGRYAPQGNVGKLTDDEIESWIGWDGEPGALIAALIESRWIDKSSKHRLLIHDWSEHADNATKMSNKRKCVDIFQLCGDTVETSGDTVSRAYPEPEPEPVLTPPSPSAGIASSNGVMASGQAARVVFEFPPDLDFEEFKSAWKDRCGALGSKLTLKGRMLHLRQCLAMGPERALAAVRHSATYTALIEPGKQKPKLEFEKEKDKSKKSLATCFECGYREAENEEENENANPVASQAESESRCETFGRTPNPEAFDRIGKKLICWNCHEKLFKPKQKAQAPQ